MTLRTLNYGNYGIFLIMGHAGFCPSTVGLMGDPGVFGTVKWVGSTAQSGLNVQKGLQFGVYGSSVQAFSLGFMVQVLRLTFWGLGFKC